MQEIFVFRQPAEKRTDYCRTHATPDRADCHCPLFSQGCQTAFGCELRFSPAGLRIHAFFGGNDPADFGQNLCYYF
jgi:hypothetical protein